MQKEPKAKVIETPVEYMGMWVAWNDDHTKIVASGQSLSKVRDEAICKGEPKPWMDRVPNDNELYGGGSFVA
ncbi:MAG: hypothetical protein WD200_00205 [Candidatus Andersenbacteria bacterium]